MVQHDRLQRHGGRLLAMGLCSVSEWWQWGPRPDRTSPVLSGVPWLQNPQDGRVPLPQSVLSKRHLRTSPQPMPNCDRMLQRTAVRSAIPITSLPNAYVPQIHPAPFPDIDGSPDLRGSVRHDWWFCDEASQSHCSRLVRTMLNSSASSRLLP